MKIARIEVYRVELPHAGGRYRLSGGRVFESFNSTDLMNYNTASTGIGGARAERGRLHAPDTPGLGVRPDRDALGPPVFDTAA